MTRSLIALALSTQIPVSEWRKEDDRTIATAWELLRDTEKRIAGQNSKSKTSGPGGPQFSG